MISKRKLPAVFLCLAIINEITFCDIIDNTTHKSVALSEKKHSRLDKFRRNTTAPLLSTRSNFVSASTCVESTKKRHGTGRLDFGEFPEMDQIPELKKTGRSTKLSE